MVDSKIVEAFDQLAPALEKFRDGHSLLLQKYWHDIPSWRFSFNHPNSGDACIELIIDDPDQVRIYCYCWKDDYDEGSRHSRTESSGMLAWDQILQTLEDNFQDLLSWSIDSLTEHTGGFRESWRKGTEEGVVRVRITYPNAVQ